MLPLAYFSLALVARAPTSVGFDDRDCNCGDDRKCHNEQHWKNAQEHGLKIALARAPLVLPPLAPPPLEESIVARVKKTEPRMTKTKTKHDPAAALTKAAVRASDLLGLKNAALASVIGVSEATVSRYKRGTAEINPNSKVGELALLLVRLLRSLDPLVGSDGEKRKAWMHSTNSALGGVPSTLILKPDGLSRTLAYLEASRERACLID